MATCETDFYTPPKGWKNPTGRRGYIMDLMVRWNSADEPDVVKEAFVTAADFHEARQKVSATTNDNAIRSTIFERDQPGSNHRDY